MILVATPEKPTDWNTYLNYCYHVLSIGVRSKDNTCPATNEKKPKVSSVCSYGNFDDVIYHKATCTTYIFRGYYMWRMNNEKQASNHERISSKFPGLPGYIDAAYTRSDGSIVFFKYNR